MKNEKSKEVVLKVVDLKQHFVTGSGKYKIYNKAVDGVSFELKRGEVFSLVGESGCGKTTTGRTIIRLYQPTDGEVYLLGKRIVGGTLGLTQGIKNARKELSNKKKQLKAEEITQEEFNSFNDEIKAFIAESKKEISERRKDQENRYLPKTEEVQEEKNNLNEQIELLKQEKKKLEKELDNLPENTDNAVDKQKTNEIKKQISKLDENITSLHISYKSAGKSLMKKLQMIFQDPIDSLNPRLTVKEIIAEGLYINGIKDKEIVNGKVYEALKLVGLMPEHASHYPHEFSGGQRQRVGIARAIVCEPEIIIADEPISALDVSIQAQVINLLQDLKNELGLTILFIAHDLSVVKHFSDKVAVMYFGHIVEIADKEKIFAHPMHPYTKSLFSSIPQPNPEYEKLRETISRYNPQVHGYTAESAVEMREVEPGHFVLCSEKEFKEYKKIINEKN